jgi:hypothetical protein
MEERISIFSAIGDGRRIGYIEGAEAFNLSGQRRCRYDERTGNLRDLGNREIVGHVSLEGRFVGLSWQADTLFRQFDGDVDRAVLQEEGPLNGTGEQLAGQEPARAEDETLKSLDSHAFHPLRQVLAVANEVFGQRDAEDDQGVRGVGEMPNPPSEREEPAVPTNASGGRSGGFPEEAERIFERLRERIGLNAQGVPNVGEMPNQREGPAAPTTTAGEQSGAFSKEVERVFEMLRNKESD